MKLRKDTKETSFRWDILYINYLRFKNNKDKSKWTFLDEFPWYVSQKMPYRMAAEILCKHYEDPLNFQVYFILKDQNVLEGSKTSISK